VNIDRSCVDHQKNYLKPDEESGRKARDDPIAGPILSVFPALIVHSELKSVPPPDFQWHLFFKQELINK